MMEKKRLICILVLMISGSFCLSCSMETPINEKPMYGNAVFTPEQKKANEEFIKKMISIDGSREEGSKMAFFTAIESFEKGDLKTAMKRFNQAWLLDPNSADVYYGFGRILDRKKDNDEAVKMYTKAIELNPKYENAYFNRGQNYFYLKKYDEAIADYSKVIEINPNSADAYNSRGYVYYTTHRIEGNLEKALSDLNKAIEIKHNYSLAYHNRALVYAMKKDYGKAWADVHTMESSGIKVDPKLIELLKKESGRTK